MANRFQYILIILVLHAFCIGSIPLSGQVNEKIYHFYCNDEAPPYEFEVKGKAMGFNIDLLNAVAEKMNLNIKIIPVNIDELELILKDSVIDGFAGILYNNSMTDLYRQSEAFIDVNYGIFVPKASEIKTIADLSGKRIIVVKNSPMHDYLLIHSITDQIMTVSSQREAITILNNGNFDCALLRSLDGGYLMDVMDIRDIRIISTVLSSQNISIAVSESNKQLILILNDGLRLVQAFGEYDTIYEKWFGITTSSSYSQQIKKTIIWAVIIALAILAIVFFWIWSLRRQVYNKTRELRKELLKRKVTEKELADEKTLLRALIDSIPDLIFYKNNDLKYIGSNKALNEFLDMEEDKMLGKTDEELFDKDKAEIFKQKDIEVLSTNKEIRIENWDKNAKGDKVLIETLKTAYLDSDGKIVGIVGISRDITHKYQIEKELKIEKEKAERADQLKSAFLANMSHEIRTPMNSIIGFSDLLGDPDLTQDQREEFIEFISSGGNQLLNLIDDIIDISKIEAGQLQFNESIVPIRWIMDELLGSYQEIMERQQKNHISLKINVLDEDSKYTIKTDQFRIKQILSNLLSNAVKYTEKGFIEFGYTVSDDRKYLNFYVRDSGIGIPEDKLQFILQRFGQLKQKNSTFSGTGLGLPISKSLIELMGGEIKIESILEKGSVFTFTIPFIEVEETEDFAEGPEKSIIPSYNWKNKTILIAEDEELNFMFLQNVLAKTSANIIWAKNGQEALDHCLNNSVIDIVLMDIKMPEMDGYEATRKIKSHNKNLPIIAQTAYAMANERAKAIDSGCNGYLAKPIKPDVLLNTIGKFL